MQENIISPRIEANLFTWYQNYQEDDDGFALEPIPTGVSEASTLGFKPGQRPVYQIWNDSADAGLILVNPNTGNEVIFILDKEEEDKWLYRSYQNQRKIEICVLNT